jgi:hypothetical protein
MLAQLKRLSMMSLSIGAAGVGSYWITIAYLRFAVP